MTKKALVLVLFIAFLFAGCASKGGYTPTVDTANDPNAQNLTKDENECRVIAEKSADTTNSTLKGVGVGALVGAAAGAAIGAAVGAPGQGAAIGAAAGGIGGGVKEGLGGEGDFKTVFKNCMTNRGHTVLD
jgi:outer membrane lipoprotein SlyB